MFQHRPAACRRCRLPFTPNRPHRSRGLHNTCTTNARNHEGLDQYPPVRRLIDHDQFTALEAQRLATADIALRLDVTTAAVRQHRRRQRQAGTNRLEHS